MNIENTKDYLKYRIIVLENELSQLTQSLDEKKFNMSEIRNKIEEIKNVVDEGFEMFSPKAAEQKNFNKQEVKDLQMRLLILVEDSKDLENKITLINNELSIIKELADKKEENIDGNNTGFINSDDLYNKLKLCADIALNDPRRVKIELEKIINKQLQFYNLNKKEFGENQIPFCLNVSRETLTIKSDEGY